LFSSDTGTKRPNVPLHTKFKLYSTAGSMFNYCFCLNSRLLCCRGTTSPLVRPLLEGTVLSFQAMSKSNLTICVLRLAVAVVLRRAVAFLVHAWSGGHSALFSDPDTVSLMADFVGEDYTLKRGSRRFFTL
jgi:hypothetical protein